MRRLLPGILLAVGVLIAVALGVREVRSAEDRPLDRAARATAPGNFVGLPQGMTHYEVSGPDSGRVVVLVHGFSVPLYIWDSTAAGLSALGYRVVRYDLYGRGFSDRPRVSYDGALYEAQLGALLDSLQIGGPVDLVGLSFGGFVVAHFTLRHSQRVRTLTLVDPVSLPSRPPGILRVPLLGPWVWSVLHVPGMADGQMTDFLHPDNHPTWVDQYRPQMRYKGFGRALLSTVLMLSGVDFDSLYGGVAGTGVPSMLVWGRQDQTLPLTQSEVVLRNIPSVEFVAVDSAGHLPHIEQAQLVTARLAAFYAAHP